MGNIELNKKWDEVLRYARELATGKVVALGKADAWVRDAVNVHFALHEKWDEVLRYAREYATGNGLHKSEPWVRDAFNEYFALHEKAVEAGRVMSFGGLSGSTHNREVMAEKVYLELRDDLNDREAPRLRETLQRIAQDPDQIRGLSR